MINIDETFILDFYLKEIETDNIIFLKGKDKNKEKIKTLVTSLKTAESMNEKISITKDLWKALFEASMSFIDPDKDGYDKLFKYFDNYVEFEELIFASDSFYRDHTLHSLWVYFLGDYILKEPSFKDLTSRINNFINYSRSILSQLKSFSKPELFEPLIKLFEDLISSEKYNESIFCVSALTHDLGYPLKKIDKINNSIGKILPSFAIGNYDKFNFDFSVVDQNYIHDFLKILSTDFNMMFDNNDTIYDTLENTEILEKAVILNPNIGISGFDTDYFSTLSEDKLFMIKRYLSPKIVPIHFPSTYARNCSDFENYKHGIMSAFLLCKNIRAFSNIRNIFETAPVNTDTLNNINLVNFPSTTTKLNILKAVSDHTSDYYKIIGIDNWSSILTFVDELEEFSRISRANQNREYIAEFCTTNIYMEDSWINIDFTFSNTSIDNLSPEKAFKGRCVRFLSLFDIPNLRDTLKIRLRCIGKLPKDKNIYTLEIAHKYASIKINDEAMDIPSYLKSNNFYTTEEYMNL